MINNGSLCYLSMLTDATPLQPTYLPVYCFANRLMFESRNINISYLRSVGVQCRAPGGIHISSPCASHLPATLCMLPLRYSFPSVLFHIIWISKRNNPYIIDVRAKRSFASDLILESIQTQILFVKEFPVYSAVILST